MTAASASFKNDVVTVFEDGTAWSVAVDSSVSDFTVTGEWVDTGWYGILGQILEDAGLCWSTNLTTHEITVSNC